jgi:hypothetical protein
MWGQRKNKVPDTRVAALSTKDLLFPQTWQYRPLLGQKMHINIFDEENRLEMTVSFEINQCCTSITF